MTHTALTECGEFGTRYKVAEFDTSVSAHGVDHAFNQFLGAAAARMSYSDWKTQTVRLFWV